MNLKLTSSPLAGSVGRARRAADEKRSTFIMVLIWRVSPTQLYGRRMAHTAVMLMILIFCKKHTQSWTRTFLVTRLVLVWY